MWAESIELHEQVLGIMDDNIKVYDPDLLQNRIAILRDTAVLLDRVGNPEAAIDYATGALVNAQTLAGILSQQQGAPRASASPMLEPFYALLAELKAKTGDAEGAAEARRAALKGRLSQGRSKGQHAAAGAAARAGAAAAGGAKKKAANPTGASTTRAGGRRK